MGYWHATLGARFAEAFEEEGAEVFAVVPDPGLVASRFPPSVHLLPAPFHVPPDHVMRGLSTRSFTDILGAAGWADARVLSGLLRAWDGLLSLVQPTHVVVDHAPTALLATSGRYPRAHVGLGFTQPPTHGANFPTLVETPPTYADDAVLAAVNEVLTTRGQGAPLEALPRALTAETNLVTTLLELDPYRDFRTRDCLHLGPVEPLPAPCPPPSESVIVVYLAADDSRTELILSEIVTLNMPIIAHIRGASLAQEARWSALGVEVSRAPLPFAESVSLASCVIHHGGAGAVAVAAATGRPQLLVPRHLEHWLNARSLVRLGVGLIAHEGGWKDAVLQLEQASRVAMRWAQMISANSDEIALPKWVERWLAMTG